VLTAVVALITVGVVASGCGIVRPVRGRRGAAEHAGFLGDYSQLAKREGYAAQDVYVKDDAAWSKYDAIYIESVSIWITDESKQPKPEDQKRITDMLYKAMHDKLGEKFKLADRPGSGVIKLRLAFTQAKGAIVPLNVITTVVPQARAVSTVLGLASDTAALVGSASGEGEATDSVTNERLAAWVDARAGTKGITRVFSKWADVEAICNYWAERARDFFVKQGVRQKTGGASNQ
jgi:hypothetical protein